MLGRTFEGRAVYQGNKVNDQDGRWAIFSGASCPSTMASSKVAGFYPPFLEGHIPRKQAAELPSPPKERGPEQHCSRALLASHPRRPLQSRSTRRSGALGALLCRLALAPLGRQSSVPRGHRRTHPHQVSHHRCTHPRVEEERSDMVQRIAQQHGGAVSAPHLLWRREGIGGSSFAPSPGPQMMNIGRAPARRHVGTDACARAHPHMRAT